MERLFLNYDFDENGYATRQMAYSIAFSFCVITGWNIFTTQHAATGQAKARNGDIGGGQWLCQHQKVWQ
jgi:hypothetical protein